MRTLMVLSILALYSCVLSAANDRTAPKTTHPAASAQAPARVDDAAIESKIRAKLAKSKVGKDGFTVHVKGGVATWEGTTNVIQHKGAATRMARTAGALEVVNNIKISEEARQRAAGNLHGGSPRRVEVKTN